MAQMGYLLCKKENWVKFSPGFQRTNFKFIFIGLGSKMFNFSAEIIITLLKYETCKNFPFKISKLVYFRT